ncbi:MAG: aspartate aminotransferase family protein [Halobacteriovorax sp.]|nr:aspartate aminotransferase family protein [Halobacteriovorax sp.]
MVTKRSLKKQSGVKMNLPKNGIEKGELFSQMEAVRKNDIKWKEGKAFSLVFNGGQELSDIIKEAYCLFFSENGLNPSAFPSLKKFENEVVGMTAGLLNGGEKAAGTMTSGGTESILMAIKTAREWAKENKPHIKEPELIMPISAHPAFNKGGHYFGVKVISIPTKKDYRADVEAMKAAINENTIMLVGSSPSYPQGVIDPIQDIASLAQENNLLMHVDACVGGIVLPYYKKLGADIPPFDFSVPGVTSMSVDLHKYGYAAKGASVVLYKNKELRRHQFYVTTDWPGGMYGSPAVLGTRPGGAIAAAWAIMNYLGEEGYLKLIGKIKETTEEFKRRIANLNDIQVAGEPDMSVICLISNTIDVFQVGDAMAKRGWHMDMQQDPNGLHLTISAAHATSIDEFFKDLEEAITEAKGLGNKIGGMKTAMAKGLLKTMPKKMVSKMVKKEGQSVGKTDARPAKMAPMYGMMAAITDNQDRETLVKDALDNLFSPRP